MKFTEDELNNNDNYCFINVSFVLVSSQTPIRDTYLKMLLNIVHQEGLFDAIKENPNFPSCRGIPDIYRQWLLKRFRIL